MGASPKSAEREVKRAAAGDSRPGLGFHGLMIRRLLAVAILLLCAAPATGEPIPYADTVAPRQNWRDKAAENLTGPIPATDEGLPKPLLLNNYWGVPQDPKHPWRGTPRFDSFDGNSDGTYAVFSDPRFSARAIAIALADWHAEGVVTATDIAARLNANDPHLAQAMVEGTGRGVAEPLGLIDANGPTGRLRLVMANIAKRQLGRGLAPSDSLLAVGLEAVRYNRFDQSEAGFRGWRAADPEWEPQIRRFEAYLSEQGLSGQFPLHQLLRTASDWKGCGAPFTVPPEEVWGHAAQTLKLISERVKPSMPRLEIMSGYRPGWLNVCAGGAERSAHREFFAFDMVPGDPAITRDGLMLRICPIYALEGPSRSMGLGFYSGVRFHIDTSSYRTWASFNRVSYAPCAADGAVNPVPDVPPPPPPFPPVYPSR